MPEPRRVTIIGIGLIGGSISMAVKAQWPGAQITGCDLDPDVQKEALAQGVIDKVADDMESCCRSADFIFIATPVMVIPKIIESIALVVGEDTIVTDVGSTKSKIVEVAGNVMPATVNFIGGHPLAGSEQAGLRAATGGLLKDAVYILTPTAKTSPEAFQKLHALLTKLGAKVVALSPEKHDEIVAAVSHLPHLTATALVNVVAAVEDGSENRLLFTAGGFRDLTRIASGNPDLWVDICLDNREAIAASIQRLTSTLGDVCQLITEGNRQGLLDVLTLAKNKRASMTLDKPADAVAREFNIPVSDKPGAISQITLTFGELGINIEDIQIVHLGSERGVIKILVNDNPNISKAVAEIKRLGYKVIERPAGSVVDNE